MIEINEKIEMDATWHEEDAAELKEASFARAEDIIKKGDPYDLLTVFCAAFAILCFSIMGFAGIKNGFSSAMITLMICYIVIVFLCLFKPLQWKVSEVIWNKSYRKNFLVNKGYSEKIAIDGDNVYYTDPSGNEKTVPITRFYDIYTSENYLVFHEKDKKIFAVKKSKLIEAGVWENLRDYLVPPEEEKQEEKSEQETKPVNPDLGRADLPGTYDHSDDVANTEEVVEEAIKEESDYEEYGEAAIEVNDDSDIEE